MPSTVTSFGDSTAIWCDQSPSATIGQPAAAGPMVRGAPPSIGYTVGGTPSFSTSTRVPSGESCTPVPSLPGRRAPPSDEHARRAAVERPHRDVAEAAAGHHEPAVGRHHHHAGLRAGAAELALRAGGGVVRADHAVAHHRDERLAVGRVDGVVDPVVGAQHVARHAERDGLVDEIEHLRAIRAGDLVVLEPRDRGGGILAQRRGGLEQHQLALPLLGLRLRLERARPLALRDVALGHDAAERLHADAAEREHAGDGHGDHARGAATASCGAGTTPCTSAR